VPLTCWLVCLLADVPSDSHLLHVTAAVLTDALLPGVCCLVLLLLRRRRLLSVRWLLHGVQGLLLLLVLLL
jgi:hypothetical protein